MVKKNASFSLIELLVFVSILSIFFIMAASVVTVSLRNMKFNEHKIKATHYANQLEEWLRTQKEIDWVSFTQSASQQGDVFNNFQTTFCFNSSPIDNWQNLDSCTAYDLDSLFKREVVFTSESVLNFIGQVNVAIIVSWDELGQVKSVVNNTVFTILE
ncbi:hypothetical protein A2954_00220 [Candidatus Roizmanbacteria bacterium RIFCSPLOWO2_01_FULL_37_12]|uniref:Type II secretion system protein GspI C-terminal domain-containing protein n=1 Tax=Candidatus Roizmanbacteria bacterium RIFCSPLOWO2_01_FULL_37_12 TaxID=1802056 RepID=A0A1F7IB56_9BACT|nr:MAG: hypothetical protein A2768_00565 [Candidatus Roizmanbacteria bacterium RIFCSPHIGHO2_01_FULL_37_16]OGK24858.1 MAG: hypothetical protein A3D76_07050 [Candidatus Roizmanbacteria bacterium RIFCSPHIGHO2_02_FULL_37_9b]OGK40589.1 MAG: hypothetical protein A2954_00220 [Candidatus Roizmanbacteria bacterium RIFCSPLOWO2_01_FULL_37_12]